MLSWKKLGECCNLEKGATPIQKAIPGEYPLVVTSPIRRSCNTYQFDKPSVCVPLVSSRGHGVASLNQVFYQEGKFALGNILCSVTPYESDLNARYLYYYLNTFKDSKIVPLMTGGANVSLTVKKLSTVRICYPSLFEQERIVSILDTFTSSIANLKEQIKERRKQYEHYRDQLLDLEGKDGVEMKTLGETCSFRNGYAFKSGKFKETGLPIIRITNISNNNIDLEDCKYFDTSDYRGVNFTDFAIIKGDILIAMSGATTGKVGIYKYSHISYLNQRVGKFMPDIKKLDKRFLYHYLLGKNQEIYLLAGGGTQPNLSSNKLMSELYIPIPSKEEQSRIVTILDQFEASIANLEAQLKEREKQYEYYRNQLLTFE